MITSNTTQAEKLAALTLQRKSNQISEWEFEQTQRDILGKPPAGRPNFVRDGIIVATVVITALGGLAIAYPAQTKIFFVILNQVAPLKGGTVQDFQDVGQLADQRSEEWFSQD